MQPDCEVAHVLHHLGKIFRLSGLTLGNFEHFMPLKSAEQPPLEVISMRVTIVATSPLVITVAATDIVPSVKENREDWIQTEAELLPVPYFHLVFTFAR